jgi:hypothetical protein
MNTILFKQSGGGVTYCDPGQSLLDDMMGSGNGWTAEECAYQSSKFQIPAPGHGWPGFSAAFSDEWVSALCHGGLTESQVEDLLARRLKIEQGYSESAVVDIAILPDQLRVDPYFRDAIVWDDDEASKCKLDMAKARVVHMDKIRVVRDAELVKKDVPFMRAVEAGDASAQSTIGTEKQVLRDIPATFDITTDVDTPEKLKAKWPTELPERE